MATATGTARYQVLPGPEGLLPPAASSMGVILPQEGEGLVEGVLVSEDAAIKELAKQMLTRRNPTIFPGPLVVWGWTKHTQEKASVVLELAAEIPGVKIIPMPDYRPIYPKIDPEAVINPCHPNLTIWHNKIEACIFVGVHCHFANITLKMVRAGTNCYTVALCAEAGHEDAMASLPHCGTEKLQKVVKALRQVKKEGVTPWALTPEGKRDLEAQREQKRKQRENIAAAAPEFAHELVAGLDENEE
jgi:hypothetical protein